VRGILRIIVGVALIIGGLTGKMTLGSTHNPTPIVAVGVVAVAMGIFRLARIR
jgi:hypothetical protein